MNERVKVYLDGEGKWRWRWWRGSRVVNSSSQGYTHKHWCLENLKLTLQADYRVIEQTKKTSNGRMYQKGELMAMGGRTVPVEVTPWMEER
jgi:uncharacterized protein YegP (UPF0339 family)